MKLIFFVTATLLSLTVQTLADESTSIQEPIQPLPLQAAVSDTAKVELGRQLFNEVKLSKNNSVSCASCHNLNTSGADNRVSALGVNGSIGPINTPTVFNSRYNFRQFWNGRAHSLEEQVGGPVENPIEMGSTWKEVIEKLRADINYQKQFFAIYKNPDFNAENVKDAMAAFEKTLVTPNSRFDQFLRGSTSALSEVEKRGYNKFKNYGCIACHQGMNVGGNMFQTMGVMGDYFKDRGTPVNEADLGLFNITKKASDKFVFRVPSLRNVELTAPYFHDGSAKKLEDAVQIMGKYQLGLHLKPVEIQEIAAFLKTLTGEKPLSRVPANQAKETK